MIDKIKASWKKIWQGFDLTSEGIDDVFKAMDEEIVATGDGIEKETVTTETKPDGSKTVTRTVIRKITREKNVERSNPTK